MSDRVNIDLIFVSNGDFGSKAAKFRAEEGGETFWLPKSQIEYDPRATDGDVVDVEMPEWLANKEGLI